MAIIVTRAAKGSPLINSELDANFTNLNTELITKLPSATYTPADILAKLITVDGTGSRLDADLLNGLPPTNSATGATIVNRDASGNFSSNIITASIIGNVTGNVTGNATNVSGTVAIANGGTSATTQAGARTNLQAAQSGANGDITSLGGLTTQISVAQGGTGATTASSARNNLGAAQNGANNDISSLASPALGNATANTPASNDNSNRVATTSFIATSATLKSNGTVSVGAYTALTSSDFGKHYYANSTTGFTIGLPTTNAGPIGSIISISNINTGVVSVIVANGGIYAQGFFGIISIQLKLGESIILETDGNNWIQVASTQNILGNVINGSALTSDISIRIGQSVSYITGAVPNIALRIATQTDQMYQIILNGSYIAAAASYCTQLQPNNAGYGSVFTVRQVFASGSTTGGTAVANADNGFRLTVGGSSPIICTSTICTSTGFKRTLSNSSESTTGSSYTSVVSSEWQDGTTPWTSLGTIIFPQPWGGIMSVKRIL